MSYSATIYREIDNEEKEIEVEIEYTYSPFHRGARDSLGGKRGAGPPLEPDEPEQVEIETATDGDGKEWELTDDEVNRFEQEILERMGEGPDDDREPGISSFSWD